MKNPLQKEKKINVINKNNFPEIEKIIKEEYLRDKKKISKLKRCIKCILPETMPFIEFDENGICNYCRGYKKREIKGRKALDKEIKKYKRKGQEFDCIVPFSGGRDSCYALHYVVKELGLNPLVYSYDWGMITEVGERNQKRMIEKLGVEHVIITADITKKRENIRKNILAWAKKTNLGMIPLFMAGDKEYFIHLNKLQKEKGIDLVIYAGNSLENTYFKHGFANVKLDLEDKKAYDIGIFRSLRLFWFYIKNHITNPSYLNRSVVDTIRAFVASFGVSKDYLYLYKYIPWSEDIVEKTLFDEYGWELAKDTTSSWRIGDGTASFYNYIYYVMAGFTENDTFRSNQIREGLITRSKALALTEKENEPRIESMLWYCDTVQIDALDILKHINKAKKIY